MQKTQINPAILQPFLESASNAAAKGQAQYFTPPEWSKALARALPNFRPVILDLHCGAGHLLNGAARPSTDRLLGCDIDQCLPDNPGKGYIPPMFIQADVCQLYPFMRAVKLGADCFALNPPWDLYQYREPLAALLKSELPAVREAFAAHDGRTAVDTIDSTVATICLALDLMSTAGEAFLIANEATLLRLIFAPNAPHRALASHVWAHLVIAGNICAAPDPKSEFQTGVIYFARDHDSALAPGAQSPSSHTPHTSLSSIEVACTALHKARLHLRHGSEIRSYAYEDTTTPKWRAITEEWQRLTRKDRPEYNLYLAPDGTIVTNLSLYDRESERVAKAEADDLFSLNGKHPMSLVMQRTHRAHLERAAFGKTWRVAPALQQAIRDAVEQYGRVRAPLYPLSAIQRLGYLDEQDFIMCGKGLGVLFKPDRSYPIRSATIAIKRAAEKLNVHGDYDDVEYDGQELAFYLKADDGSEYIFMEERLRSPRIRLSILKAGEKPGQQDENNIVPCTIDFTLHQLVEHFVIPDVPDVARVHPDEYQRNLKLLAEIEQLTEAA